MGLQIFKVTPRISNGNVVILLSPTLCEIDSDAEHSTMIMWILDDRAKDARFANDSKGPLIWNDANDGKILDKTASVANDGDLIWIFDRHRDESSKADKQYTVRVEWKGVIYETEKDASTESGIRGKSPVIINR